MKRLGIMIAMLALAAAGMTACVKDVVLDAMEDPQLVVSCVLTVDSVQTLYLSYTKGALREEAPRVSGAAAVLTDLTENRETGQFIQTADDTWQLKYTPVPAHRYRLDITVPGHEPVWAEQTMPEAPEIESFDFMPWMDSYFSLPFFDDHLVSGMLYRSKFPCTVLAYAERYNVDLQQRVPVEEIYTDYPDVSNINLTGKVRERYGDDELWRPRAGYSAGIWDYYTTGAAYHRRFLRFPKRESEQEVWFAIDGDFRGNFYNRDDGSVPLETEGVLYFSSLTEEYDKYMCEAWQRHNSQQTGNLADIYNRDNLYTNIKGGLGIFGAMTEIAYRWRQPRKLYRIEDPDPPEYEPMG